MKITKEEREMDKKHQAAVKALYKKHGVGSSTKQKLAFWEAKEGKCYISHNPSDKERVAIIELTWLVDEFCEDFDLH